MLCITLSRRELRFEMKAKTNSFKKARIIWPRCSWSLSSLRLIRTLRMRKAIRKREFNLPVTILKKKNFRENYSKHNIKC